MLTGMSEHDCDVVLQVFRAALSRHDAEGRDDRKLLEALHYFTAHNISWRAASGVRQLEHRVEAVLTAQPGRSIRGLLPDAGRT